MSFPDSLEKKKLLYDKDADMNKVKSLAAEYLAADRLHEALEMFHRLNDSDSIRSLQQRAISMGDFMLYKSCCRFLEMDPAPEDLTALIDHAKQQGKQAFADQAYAILHPESESKEDDDDPEEEE